jgi:hypothetical protein
VCTFPRDEEKEAYQVDRNYIHGGHHATIEDSIEDAAFEACLGLCGRRFDDMKWDHYRFLPHEHPVMGWAMMDPENLDPIPRVMVDFAYDLMEKNRRLESMMIAQGKSLKRCQQVIDDHRISLDLPRIYEKLDHEPCPQGEPRLAKDWDSPKIAKTRYMSGEKIRSRGR